MNKYFEDLKEKSETKSTKVVLNDGPKKAAVFMGRLLSHATQTVQVYSSMLNKEVTSNPHFMEPFIEVLANKNIRLEILLDQETNNVEIQRALEQHRDDNNSIKYLVDNECVVEALGEDNHFTIIDNSAFRLEKDIVNFVAFGSFNDTETSQTLSEFFDYLSDKCVTAQDDK